MCANCYDELLVSLLSLGSNWSCDSIPLLNLAFLVICAMNLSGVSLPFYPQKTGPADFTDISV